MNNRKYIIAGVVAVLFCFAGYNLYSYFKTQQAIQMEEDRQVQERRIQRETEAREREAARLAQIENERLEAEAKENAREEERARKLAEEEARKEAKRLAQEEEKRAAEERRTNDRITKARTIKRIEGLKDEVIAKLNQVSADYILDHPDEFSTQTFSGANLGAYRPMVKLLDEGTNSLMLYAAVSSDLDVIKALLDIGIDVNAINKRGYSALMFAAAYNQPKVVRFLLGQGANKTAMAHVQNLNALHLASLLNPHPDMVETLVNAGLPLEGLTENEYTPLLLALTDNRNLEVAERLANLGANTKAYDEQGRNAYTLAKIRMDGEGDDYVMISEAVNERILRKMR